MKPKWQLFHVPSSSSSSSRSGFQTALAILVGIATIIGVSLRHQHVVRRIHEMKKKNGPTVDVGLLRIQVPHNYRDVITNDVLLEQTIACVSHTLLIYVSGRNKHEVLNYSSALYGTTWDIACGLAKPLLDIRYGSFFG